VVLGSKVRRQNPPLEPLQYPDRLGDSPSVSCEADHSSCLVPRSRTFIPRTRLYGVSIILVYIGRTVCNSALVLQ
jgi:hypothetical protein